MIDKHSDIKFSAIVIGGSAGSFPIVVAILEALPENFQIPIILTLHRIKDVRHGFLEALSLKSTLPIVEPHDKQQLRKGKIYLAPANYHLAMELGNSITLSIEPLINNPSPSIDLTLDTASYVYKERLLAILLSGANNDGAVGMKKVNDRGGVTIIQTPSECVIDTMPQAALKLTDIDYTFDKNQIKDFLLKLEYYFLDEIQ